MLIVTGATSGIGKAYAIELAQRGLDLVLISRSSDKLQMAAQEIEGQFGRKTRTIQADFTDGHSIYPAISEGLQGLEIGILVNNVGMNPSDELVYFLETTEAEQRITQVINCNTLSVTQMTRLVLPGMVERGKGLIINISSEMASRPQPLVSLYSATKIFITYFSQCLHAEYKSKGIIVQCVSPSFVSTNMTNNIPVSYFVKSASDFVRQALNTVGHTTNTSGCLAHALQHFAMTVLLPDWFRMSSFLIIKLRSFEKFSVLDKTQMTKKQD
ncbi:hypothetical protein LDENG_00024030 [Lucifuga dentata]|nr:hypothetical protein LDENG_00024030 [Lucifuga dentata]